MMTKLSPQGQTTMLQDIEAKRRTEVDYLACTVAEQKLNVPTNHWVLSASNIHIC
jgi:2-dehydropantoate 2-reductase